jgi:hypothetical protein
MHTLYPSMTDLINGWVSAKTSAVTKKKTKVRNMRQIESRHKKYTMKVTRE